MSGSLLPYCWLAGILILVGLAFVIAGTMRSRRRSRRISGGVAAPVDRPAAMERGGAFLAGLSDKEKCAVGNLNPVLYSFIIQEKRGEAAPQILSMRGTGDLDLVRKLPIKDIEILSRSVEVAQKGDQAASQGDLAAAAGYYRQAVDLNPYADLALMSYGAVLYKQGRIREGIQWVERALKVNPDNDRARRNLDAMRASL